MPTPSKHSRRFAFLLLPGFSMMSLSALLEPLRMANKISHQELYRWRLYSADDNPVAANNGIHFQPDQPLSLIHI